MYNNLGWVHRRLAPDLQLIIDYYEKALDMCKGVPDESQVDWCLMATILNNLVTSQPEGDLDLALKKKNEYITKTLATLPEKSDKL